MLKIKQLSIFLFILSITINTSYSQSFLKASGKKITNEAGEDVLLRGMGLGGWMLQEGYMMQTSSFAGPEWEIRETIEALVGAEETQNFYDLWLENHVQKADMDSLKAWGFNSVRVPMHYKLFTLPIEQEPIPGQHTWLDKGFELTDRMISWCAQNDMYVILDLHGAPGGQGQAQEISDYNPALPSLWESNDNKEKTVALWRRIAERYKDEPYVAAYDLLNEPNWNLPGGTALRALYVDITEAIREVDDKHMLIIEGNWFANDFTGIFPLWDDNIALGPHKYWSYNNPSDNDWLTDLRDNNNVPIYLGESGENSNVWYTDAIRLLESEGFSWAWWTEKKIESTSGLLSIKKTAKYQALLDYWSGNGPKPSHADAVAGLTEIATNARIENCTHQKDVVDAMFRQVQTDETKAYKEHTIPGIIHATDYDLGRNGIAYYDIGDATYHVATGNFTAWNNGWQYRNDGVDIEFTEDNINTNGYNVGWLDEGEWMKYSVNVTEDGLYNIITRVAGGTTGGEFRFAANDSELGRSNYVPVTGGYQNWQSVIAEDVMLTTEDNYITFKNLGSGYNLNSFEFVRTGDSDAVDAIFTYAETIDESNISLQLSKPLKDPLNPVAANFSLQINGNNVAVSSAAVDPTNNRKIILSLDIDLVFTHVIKVSYNGTAIQATDDTPLLTFTLEDVHNNLASFHTIPGKIEAEDYSTQSGIQLEDCTDTGLGQNIGYLDPGDYLDYEVNVQQAGIYTIDVRHASENSSGALVLELINPDNGSIINIFNGSFPSTGGWQNWDTKSASAQIPNGRFTMRLRVTGTQFNVNWIEFKKVTSTDDRTLSLDFVLSPNPSFDFIQILSPNLRNAQMSILSMQGKTMIRETISDKQTLQIKELPSGTYILRLINNEGHSLAKKFVKL